MPHIVDETRSDASKESSKLLWKSDIVHEGKKEQKRGRCDERGDHERNTWPTFSLAIFVRPGSKIKVRP